MDTSQGTCEQSSSWSKFMFLSEPSNKEAEKNYIVLARRTRPQSLAELVGQEVVANSITSMLVSGKIPHAFLFTGTRGTGKTSSARILAKSLCCEKGPTPHPCQVCVHCKQITACAHDDVLEIDGASNTGVDNVRELNEAARFYPHSAKFKIFIIDEVHMLSTGAFNALLKTLEEPPSQVVFILATTELHKVPITVRSRCMIFSFKKIELTLIANHLKEILAKEKITYDEDAIQIIAREAKGSLRDSLSLLEQAIAICGSSSNAAPDNPEQLHLSAEETRKGLCVQGEELAEKLFSAICKKNTEEAFVALQAASMASLDISSLIENTAGLFRSALLVKNLENKERTLRLTQLLAKEYEFLEQESQKLSSSALSEIFKALSLGVREISRSTAPLSWAEVITVDCILRADWLSASEMLALLNQENSSEKIINRSEKKNTVIVPNSSALPPLGEKLREEKLIEPRSSPVIPNASVTSAIQTSDISSLGEASIDLTLFKKFVELTRTRSELLATRLKFVKVNIFSTHVIEFADTHENATYLSFNEQDTHCFWSCIKEFGLEKAQIKGKYLPPKINKQLEDREQTKDKVLEIKKEKTNVEIQEHKDSAKMMLKNFQKFSQPNLSSTNKTTSSLNEIYNEEKNKAHLAKENKILAKESMQELKKLATEIRISDL